MQAGFKFFTKRVIDETLARYARLPLERGGNQRQAVMRLPAGLRARMTVVQLGLIFNHDHLRRQLRREQLLHALGARKMLFVVCQFLVRLTSRAHTR